MIPRRRALFFGVALLIIGLACFSIARAQIGPLGFGPIPPFGKTSSTPPSVTYVTAVCSQSPSSNTFTYSGVSLSTADSTRIIVVAANVEFSSAGAFSSGTIGGVSATKVKDQINGTQYYISLLAAAVPSGTTGNIVITYTGTVMSRSAVGVWALYNLANAGTASLTASSTANPLSLNMNTLTGDIVIGAGTSANAAGSASWTGLTKRFDVANTTACTSSGGDAVSGADVTTVSPSTPLTISASGEFSSSPAGVAAIFR